MEETEPLLTLTSTGAGVVRYTEEEEEEEEEEAEEEEEGDEEDDDVGEV